jgi:hypothetical protein
MGCLAAVSATDMIATTSLLFAARHAKAYRLVIRKPPFPECRFINTLIGSASRMNDSLIRWLCALFKDVYETLQHRVLHGRELRLRDSPKERLAGYLQAHAALQVGPFPAYREEAVYALQ